MSSVEEIMDAFNEKGLNVQLLVDEDGGFYASAAPCHDAQSKQGESQRAGENLVHAYRAAGLPSANQADRPSHPPYSSTLGLCGSYESLHSRRSYARLPRMNENVGLRGLGV
jgi:hypothetical protein